MRPVHRSGAVEAGCKAVIGQRLKSSGMRSTASADAIIALRCREASSQWEEIGSGLYQTATG